MARTVYEEACSEMYKINRWDHNPLPSVGHVEDVAIHHPAVLFLVLCTAADHVITDCTLSVIPPRLVWYHPVPYGTISFRMVPYRTTVMLPCAGLGRQWRRQKQKWWKTP